MDNVILLIQLIYPYYYLNYRIIISVSHSYHHPPAIFAQRRSKCASRATAESPPAPPRGRAARRGRCQPGPTPRGPGLGWLKGEKPIKNSGWIGFNLSIKIVISYLSINLSINLSTYLSIPIYSYLVLSSPIYSYLVLSSPIYSYLCLSMPI